MKIVGALLGSGLRLSEWFERWFPDAYALAIVAVLLSRRQRRIGNSPAQTAQWFGAGFWDLVAFTMQVTMLIISGFAVASAPPVHAVIRRLAAIPKTAAGAAAFVALFSMLSSLVSWTFSLIFSGLLAREVTHRVRGADYRAVASGGLFGRRRRVGFRADVIGRLDYGYAGFAASSNFENQRRDSVERNVGIVAELLVAGTLVVVSVIIAYSSAPGPEQARSMEEMGVAYEVATERAGKPQRPGEWSEYSPVLTVLMAAMGLAYLVREVASKGFSVLLELNHYIFLFLALGLLLHWTPRSFMKAIADAVPSVAGVLVQYPLYAGAVRMMTESGLATRMAHFFISASTAHTFPILIGVYSVVLGLFVPSAGGKWLVEAPYVLEAAKTLHVHLGWVVQIYNATESLANLIHPFWMLPLLGILGLKARDIVGYAMLQFVVHLPLVLFLVWLLNLTLLNR